MTEESVLSLFYISSAKLRKNLFKKIEMDLINWSEKLLCRASPSWISLLLISHKKKKSYVTIYTLRSGVIKSSQLISGDFYHRWIAIFLTILHPYCLIYFSDSKFLLNSVIIFFHFWFSKSTYFNFSEHDILNFKSKKIFSSQPLLSPSTQIMLVFSPSC